MEIKSQKITIFALVFCLPDIFWLRSESQKLDFELVSNELRSICFDRGGSLLARKNKILRAEKNETYEFNKINRDLASRVVFRVPIR